MTSVLRPSSLFLLLLFLPMLGFAQPAPRQDAIWAASRPSAAMVLDGVLDEVDWSRAPIHRIGFGENAGFPSSGFVQDVGTSVADPSQAELRFLVVGDYLYLGMHVSDRSIGGGRDLNRSDGLMMAIMDHAQGSRPAPPAEFHYTWWYPQDTGPSPAGRLPRFLGRWAEWDIAVPRSAEMVEMWDAVTQVQGVTNDDAQADAGYTVEMRILLSALGYHPTRPQGDIVEFTFCLWDADGCWPESAEHMSVTRTWWQGPWGNANALGVLRIHVRPDVTDATSAPAIPPDLVVPDGQAFDAPVIDGELSFDDVWALVPKLELRWGEGGPRDQYAGIGPWRSGWNQADIAGRRAPITDTANATIRSFYRGSMLYVAAEVQDHRVQSVEDQDRWDGLTVILNNPFRLGPDQVPIRHVLTFRLDQVGQVVLEDDAPALRDSAGALFVSSMLLAPTTVDKNDDEDGGYTFEIGIDLARLGYPDDPGNEAVFLSYTLHDGDSYPDIAANTGTRTWWFRENAGSGAPAWALLDKSTVLDAPALPPSAPSALTLTGSYPHPVSNLGTITFALGKPASLRLTVTDLLGRVLLRESPVSFLPGTHQWSISTRSLPSGWLLYHLDALYDSGSRERKSGRMAVVR